ncbi:CAP domain-containing protein [Aspergillus unguis]
MKSSMILGAALCALGAMAEVEPSYVTEWTTTTVTDWTVVTVTKTITVSGTPTAKVVTSTATSIPISTDEPTTTTAFQPQVKVKDSSAEPLETSTSTSTVEPTSTAATEQAQPTSWSTSWESTWSSTQTATQEPSTTTAAASTQAPANTYQYNVLNSHNVHRANHSASDLTWSSDLQQSAQVLASRCVYEHDTSINGGNYGQNIGYGTSADDVAVMISNLMYNDEMGYFTDLYGEATPDMTLFEKWGHFSQIVWGKTTHVGCATVSCNQLGNVDSTEAVPFTVCNYSPAGNYDGEYADNVKAPLGQPMWSA